METEEIQNGKFTAEITQQFRKRGVMYRSRESEKDV
jgi:hypothetical protein